MFIATLENVCIMYVFVLIGYCMRRKSILPEQSGKTMSVLVTSIFLPALAISNLSANLRPDRIAEYLSVFLWGFGFMVASILIGILFGRMSGKSKITRNAYTYIFTFANTGYFGYPIIGSVFGEEMLAKAIIFTVPLLVATNTYGYLLLTNQGKSEMSASSRIKLFLSPPVVGSLLGILFGLMPMQIPAPVAKAVSIGADCMSPMAMLLVGFVLGSFPFRELFRSKAAYVVSAIRLVLIPSLFGIPLWLLGQRGDSLILPLVMTALPVGMNVVVFTEANGIDNKEYSRICFISCMMAAFIIPIAFSLIAALGAGA